MTNRLKHCFTQTKPFIAYMTAGLGDMDRSFNTAMAMLAGGVDMLEIGVPFSDPILDGPTIQSAMCDALKAGTTLSSVLQLCQKIRRQSDCPLILFSYYNPILQAGPSIYAQAFEAGVDAVLIVDVPLEEQDAHVQACAAAGLGHIHLIAPNTSIDRVQRAEKTAPAFYYYACRAGTTGVQNQLPDDFDSNMQRFQSVCTAPIVAGFGISDADMASAVLDTADGFVVGSKLVQASLDGATPEAITALCQAIKPCVRVSPSR